MTSTSEDIEQIAGLTLAYYNARAEIFWEGTRDHDVRQNIDALLDAIPGVLPLTILDFGCGPGRDLKVFKERGHVAVGLDGSREFATMARAYSGCEVLQQDFLKLDLPAAWFDGVFANATLFHIPSQELPRVLSEIYAALKPGGILFSSIPHGNGTEGWNNERYAVYHQPEAWRCYGEAAGFTELHHFYRPTGLPRDQQPWLASVWRR